MMRLHSIIQPPPPFFFPQTNFARLRSRSASRKALKRKREESAKPRSQTRSLSRPPRDKSGMRDEVVSALEHFHI